MERLKRILEKFLFPRLWVTLLCVPIAAAGLFYVLGGGDQTGVIAYAVYVFSAYALTLVCVRVIKTAKHAKEDTEKLMDRMPLVRRYVEDIPFRMQVSLYQNLGLNMLYAVIKLGFGIYYHSLWFGTLAGYYFSLALMRFVLLRYANKAEFGQNRVAEWNRYRLCGILLLIMNLALSGVVILMIREDEGFHYAGMLIYIMAIYNNLHDLIISDIMMPDIDGFAFAESVRSVNKHIPILFMSARDDLPAKQKGFRLGIDDYMVKPVQLDELLLRVRALLRRANIEMERKLTVGSLELDADGMTATVDGEEIPVTTREFNILYKLLPYPKKTLSRAQLMDEF